MEKKPYSDLFKDPRWQKKRLEILQRDNFKCRSCKDDLSTLHVHHLCYDYKIDPWDYKNDDLITLCETCHEALHYLEANKNISIYETFVPLLKLLGGLVDESIDKYLASYKTF